MSTSPIKIQTWKKSTYIFLLCSLTCACQYGVKSTAETHHNMVREVPGLIAFWDFEGESEHFPWNLRRIGDSVLYSPDSWPYSDLQSSIQYDDTGPFGKAIRFNRGYIYGSVERDHFRNTELDIKGRRAFTLVAWVKFVGERHLVAGIWDEGGWNKYAGRRQVALFAGLFRQKGVIAHVSSTGAASYPQSDTAGSQYARIRAIDGAPFADHEWVCMAMSFDPIAGEVCAYLNGHLTEHLLTDPVEYSVFRSMARSQANPLQFDGPIYGEDILVTKLSPSSNAQIMEHRIEMDLMSNYILYEFDEREGLNDGIKYRVVLKFHDDNGNDLTEPIYAYPDQLMKIFKEQHLLDSTHGFEAALERMNDEHWVRDGSPVRRKIEEGAPFTFGRALGLASEEIEHGSQLFMDGVAVYNRALTGEELQQLAFTHK